MTILESLVNNQVPEDTEHRRNYVKVRSFGQMLDVMMRAGSWDKHHTLSDTHESSFQGRSNSDPERSYQVIQVVKKIAETEQYASCMLAMYATDDQREAAKLIGLSNSRVSQLMKKIRKASNLSL